MSIVRGIDSKTRKELLRDIFDAAKLALLRRKNCWLFLNFLEVSLLAEIGILEDENDELVIKTKIPAVRWEIIDLDTLDETTKVFVSSFVSSDK